MPATVEVPAWAKDAVFYQIFPDRFARSERVLKPVRLRSWDSPPTPQGFQGGDLLGVVERLDYLDELGITALYLTPIFQSACNHRYHTHDYEKVDPLLGGNAALRELISAAHKRNIRVILDGVFNHASRGFFPFHDILENGSHSPWLDWFLVEHWPLAPYDGRYPAGYTGWLGNRALPKFNTHNPQVREYLLGIGEFWIREYDIDGWRLDVPAEITTPGFWEEFRARVCTAKPDAYLVGEVWREAPAWLGGDRFHATMNYVFAAATIAFAAGHRVSPKLVQGRSYDPYPGTDAPAFGRRIEQLLKLYDWETTQVQFNLLDSHDTPRLLSIARGDKATLRLATLFQLTFPGTPCIYYGDEIALRGTHAYDSPHQDHDARWPFPWHDPSCWDLEMQAFFRQAIALRHAHPALRHGEYFQRFAEGLCYAFERRDESETLVVVLNAGEEQADFTVAAGPSASDDASWGVVFGAGRCCAAPNGQIAVSVPGRSGCVIAAGGARGYE